MTDITFITSNQTKLAHARYLCKGYNVNILQYKKMYYGKPYEEPRIMDRVKLLEASINDAIKRWKKNVSSYGKRLFFIEDTSVKIDALSHGQNDVPGVDIKYWMQEHDFQKLDNLLKKNGNNRKVTVSSHIILFLTNDIKNNLKTDDDYLIFSSSIQGEIAKCENIINTQILYPWLDNKSFNKWFVPDGYNKPISLLEINEADKVDFRKEAFINMLTFLTEQNAIKHHSKEPILPRLNFSPLFVICGPTCAGKSTIGRLLLENYNYYHIEASDFMSVKYFETHGTKFEIDKNKFAGEFLKIEPLFVVEESIKHIQSKNLFDNFIITGFRTKFEVEYFIKPFSTQKINLIYIDADIYIRFERWKSRKRDPGRYTIDEFKEINELQDSMGLSQIGNLENIQHYTNNGTFLQEFKDDFSQKVICLDENRKINNLNDLSKIKKINLEKAILISLAIDYKKDESKYFTTTEISHLINAFFCETKKSKDNVSRYFNQTFYPFYEIKRENGKNKFKLSPTGYSEAIFQINFLFNN